MRCSSSWNPGIFGNSNGCVFTKCTWSSAETLTRIPSYYRLSIDGLTPLNREQRAQYHRQRRNLEQFVQAIGPCPRDIFSAISSPDRHEERIRSALRGIRGMQDIHDLFATADRNLHWHGQQLILLRRAHVTSAMDMDWPIVCFKSRNIGLRAMLQVGYLGIEDASKMFVENSRWPQSRALSHWIFESLAIGIISGGGSQSCVYVRNIFTSSHHLAWQWLVQAISDCLTGRTLCCRYNHPAAILFCRNCSNLGKWSRGARTYPP